MAEKFTQEQLQHYIDHPDEVDATNTPLIEALASAELDTLGVSEADRKELGLDPPKGEADDAETKKIADEAIAKAEAEEAAKAKADADAQAAAAKAAADKAGTDEGAKERVLTKDGKNTLPFEVLQDARARAAGAEAALAEAQATVLAYGDRIKALEAGKADPGTGKAATVEELEAKLAELDELANTAEEEAPWLKGMRTLINTVKTLQERVSEYEQEREETEEQAQARVKHAVHAALEANPTLVLWQSLEDQSLFQEATDFDIAIRNNPAQARRYPTFEARFEQVVKLVRANHEGEDLPLPQATAAPAKQPSAAELKARADAAIKKAEDATTVRTLTDVPGGQGEVTTEERLERMDSVELAEKFRGMTLTQVVDFVMTH